MSNHASSVPPTSGSSRVNKKIQSSAQPRVIETPPAPGRTAVAIAGYPYSPKAALADIGDNSFEAGASKIAFFIKTTGMVQDGIIVADNGNGISPDILDEVLRPGSYTQKLYSKNSLSRYGIGLKGAGFSLGRRITILTRFDGLLQRRSIDLDEIARLDRWVQDARDPEEKDQQLFEWAMTEMDQDLGWNGTVVIIEHLNIRSQDKTRLVNDFVRNAGEIYGKFLGATEGNPLLTIMVDGKEIRGVDPLHREGAQTLTLYDREEIKLDDGHTLYFSAVVLPHPKQLKDKDLERAYRYTQDNQGIYVYRNNRLISSGETFGLFGRDFHLNAFRAELEYTTAADEHVQVDVAKSSVILSAEALRRLQEYVQICVKTANTLWREKDVLTEQDILDLFDESNRLIESKAKLLVQRFDARTGRVHRPEPKQTETRPIAEAPPSSPPATAVSDGAAVAKPQGESVPPRPSSGAYLNPVDDLPGGCLYRPRWDGQNKTVIVDVNLSHPFSKAVFSVPPDESKRRVPRKATTAVQQLLYVLGATEYGFDQEDEVFEQFRNFASLNLRALLRD